MSHENRNRAQESQSVYSTYTEMTSEYYKVDGTPRISDADLAHEIALGVARKLSELEATDELELYRGAVRRRRLAPKQCPTLGAAYDAEVTAKYTDIITLYVENIHLRKGEKDYDAFDDEHYAAEEAANCTEVADISSRYGTQMEEDALPFGPDHQADVIDFGDPFPMDE